MQLGSRWQAGDAPHPGVPELLHAAIDSAETEYPNGHSWTLTWLEGRPRVELLDSGANLLCDINVTPQGKVNVKSARADEPENGSSTHAADSGIDTVDDDDDWLT